MCRLTNSYNFFHIPDYEGVSWYSFIHIYFRKSKTYTQCGKIVFHFNKKYSLFLLAVRQFLMTGGEIFCLNQISILL